jgi:hypothetical protein
LWAQGEYLLWWARGNDVPPLVTSGPQGTLPSLGQPGTVVLFGDSDLGTDVRSGFKVTLGYWLFDCQRAGLEGSFLDLGRQTTRFAIASQEQPVLGRPFSNVQTGTSVPDVLLIAFPGILSGSVNAQGASEFQAAEALWRENLWRDCAGRIDFLLGYRYARLSDALSVNQTSQFLTVFPAGTTKTLFDQFDTNNEFHGGQLGLALHERRCLWTLDLLLKVALGNTTALAVVDGATTTTVPGVPAVTTRGGVLAQPTNIGRYRQDHCAVLPELGFTLGYDLTCRLRATFGYSLVYWSHVARSGDQIDFSVNPTQFPPGPLTGPARPAFNFASTDYWTQGMNFGLEYRF